MDSTKATPIQRVTLIFLRLMLASVIAVAVLAKFDDLVAHIDCHNCSIGVTVVRHIVTVTYSEERRIGFQYSAHLYGNSSSRYEGYSLVDFLRVRRVRSGTRTQIVAFPGFTIGFWQNLQSAPNYFVEISHSCMISIALLLNVVAHWFIRRGKIRTTHLNPSADS